MRLAATLEYDGTEFSGFQRQNNAETIQELITLEEQMLVYMQFHKFLTLKQILKEMKLIG